MKRFLPRSYTRESLMDSNFSSGTYLSVDTCVCIKIRPVSSSERVRSAAPLLSLAIEAIFFYHKICSKNYRFFPLVDCGDRTPGCVDINHTPSYGLDKSGRAEVGSCWYYSRKIQSCILISWSWLEVGCFWFAFLS
jgi:hypothetical protein